MYMTTAVETYKDGQIILEEGSHGDWIYVVESGSVQILKKIGDKDVVIETLKEGEVFGELGYIAKVPRIVTVKAVGETTVAILDKGFLDAEFNKLSSEFRTILRTLSLRLEKTTSIAAETILRRQEVRIQKVLGLQFENKEELIKAYSRNVSSGGIFVCTEDPLPQGERFMLNLFLPNDPEALKIECEVSWTRRVTIDPKGRPLGMGVKFVKISHDDLRKLKENFKQTVRER
jgi:CRP/FNR family cyclic AMP-dependent transcriptional regulator